MVSILRLKKRAEFLRVKNSGKSVATSGLVLQVAASESPDISSSRLGFTATSRIGNAVRRNLIKRRLRAVSSEVMGRFAMPGYDYVIIGRSGTANRAFISLVKDLKYALHTTGTFRAQPIP